MKNNFRHLLTSLEHYETASRLRMWVEKGNIRIDPRNMQGQYEASRSGASGQAGKRTHRRANRQAGGLASGQAGGLAFQRAGGWRTHAWTDGLTGGWARVHGRAGSRAGGLPADMNRPETIQNRSARSCSDAKPSKIAPGISARMPNHPQPGGRFAG